MKNKIWIIGVVALTLLGVILLSKPSDTNTDKNKYDDFAKCLTEKNVKMYGAYWCGHCKNQKDAFEDSWQYATYIECSLPGGSGQTKECTEEGIEGYPTWEFGEEDRLSGELPFETLAEKSGCELPN